MSLAVTFVMTLSVAVTYPIYFYVLVPTKLEYLQTIVFILVIAALVQIVEAILKKYIPSLYSALGIYLPLITTNCAVLGITVLVVDKTSASFGFAEALVNALGSGIGYLVAMVLFSGVRGKMEHADIPDFFKGMPITLVAAGVLALAFSGFTGIVENMLA
ncbi:MAG: Rnf-Nqr domain containing protein [Clostridia bacterium]